MASPATDTDVCREIVGTVVHSHRDIAIGDQLAVLGESSNKVRINLETDTIHREPQRLIAWVAITGSVPTQRGADSHDVAYLLGSWVDSGGNEAIPVRVSGTDRIKIFSLRGDSESRLHCQIRMGNVVVRVRPI